MRARRLRQEHISNNAYEGACQLSKIRRTVWDGEQELYEIQMPDSSTWRENDSGPVEMQQLFGEDGWPIQIDPNPFFGRVSYVHGADLDRPLSVIRAGYGTLLDSLNFPGQHKAFPTVAFSPIWNERGQPVSLVFSNGIYPSRHEDRWMAPLVPLMWFAYVRGNLLRLSWHGSLLEDRQDATGTHNRRNRHYDPQSGRFTQEDPIGIAGGLNLYGYAGGDPVNFSDPFGLCPMCLAGLGALWGAFEIGASIADAAAVIGTTIDYLGGRASGGELGTTLGFAAAGVVSVGGGGAAARRVVSRVGENAGLTRLASRLSGRAQQEVDAITSQLQAGNLSPGIGSRHLFNGIWEARGRSGGRVAYRVVDGRVEILGKFDKADQDRALNLLREGR